MKARSIEEMEAQARVAGGALPSTFGFMDGREQACLVHVRSTATKGDMASVTRAIDEFCYTNKWMMNVGDVKGKILQASLERHKPRLVLELGTYVGYSSLKMLQVLPPDARILSVEMSKRIAAVARDMLEFAGVSSRVTVVEGHLGDGGKTVKTLEETAGVAAGALEFTFIDHDKDAYLPDLKCIMARSWLKPGAVVFADNVLFPGAPDYRQFMKDAQGRIFQTVETQTLLEYQSTVPDLVLESVFLGTRKL